MNTIVEFLSMGGYGEYIWPAYILSIIFLAWSFVNSFVELRKNKKKLEILDNNNPRRHKPLAFEENQEIDT